MNKELSLSEAFSSEIEAIRINTNVFNDLVDNEILLCKEYLGKIKDDYSNTKTSENQKVKLLKEAKPLILSRMMFWEKWFKFYKEYQIFLTPESKKKESQRK